MADFYTEITEKQMEFIRRQHIFFVASAVQEGRVNLSPKGMDTFRVLDKNTVAYLDIAGSGNETAAHLQHDGRITIMMCSFDPKPNIMRLYGTGEAIALESPEGEALMRHFDPVAGQRQIIRARITSVQDSCGFAVPRMDFREARETLADLWEERGEETLAAYIVENNTESLDGLPIDR